MCLRSGRKGWGWMWQRLEATLSITIPTSRGGGGREALICDKTGGYPPIATVVGNVVTVNKSKHVLR